MTTMTVSAQVVDKIVTPLNDFLKQGETLIRDLARDEQKVGQALEINSLVTRIFSAHASVRWHQICH